MNISIVGCGWLGLPLGEYLVNRGHHVNGSTTSTEKFEILRSRGIYPFHLKAVDQLEGNFDGLFKAEILVINIPPGRRNPNVVKDHPVQIRLLVNQAKSNRMKHIIFVSSTSVYQDTGKLIDEEGPCIPSRSSGQALLRAESIVRASGIKWTIVRFGGLVGADRHPGKWLAGKVDLPHGDSPVNMIHLDDCICAMTKLIETFPTNEIYNLCASEHPSKDHFFQVQAKKSGDTPPIFKEGSGPHKIVDNSKFKKKFNFEYKFADPLGF